MAYQASSYPVKPMNATDRILGEAQKVRPPTQKELTDPGRAYLYARDVIYGRFPEGEAALATDPEWAYDYAVDVIKGRWPEAEAAIATDPGFACCYARDTKDRFPEGEKAIATDPIWSKWYLELYPEARLGWAMRGWIPLDTSVWGI